MNKLLDSEKENIADYWKINVYEAELSNTLGKDKNPLSLPAMA